MKKSFLSIFLLFLCMVQTGLSARPVQLYNFQDLMSAIKKGHQVRAVIHYGQCKLVCDGKEIKAPDAIGGMEITPFEYFNRNAVKNPQAYLVFSHASLINLKGYIYNYAKFKVFEDNRVEVTAQYAKTNSYRIIMDETFYTTISNREGKGALYLFCEM